jgi:hypothetical protein
VKINRPKLEDVLKRNKHITFTEIGRQFGICRERVRQIAKQLTPPITGKDRTDDLEFVKKRLLGKVKIDGKTNCWPWIGAKYPLGYGHFSWKPSGGYAHRAAYLLFKGEIPDNREIDHLCRMPSCVNPDHLETVTHKVNIHRSPIAIAAINKRKTYCIRGHPFSGVNLGLNKSGRFCRTCARIRANDYYLTKVYRNARLLK